MPPPTPRLRPVPLPLVRGGPPSYPPVLPSPPPAVELHPILRPSSHVNLHPILIPSSQPRLYYDIARPPSTIIFDGTDRASILATYATTPPLVCFRIIPPTTPQWPVMVYNPRGVTVFDVLSALYHSLRTPVSPSVWDGLSLPYVINEPPGPPRARSHDHPRGAQPVPVTRRPECNRRIDRLNGRTMFAGLQRRANGSEEWVLNTTEL